MYHNIHWEYCNILQYTNFPNTQVYTTLCCIVYHITVHVPCCTVKLSNAIMPI